MIDIASFDKNWSIINHTLDITEWDWSRIDSLVLSQTAINKKYYREFDNGGFTLGGLDNDPFCKIVLSFLHNLQPNFYARAGLYVSTTSNSKTFDLHKDPGQHLWIWQIIGNTPWQVDNSQITLAQNQMLYIPPNVSHCAIPDSPRASITFSLEEFD